MIDGDYIHHHFPQDMGLMDEGEDTGRPKFVKYLLRIYERKKERASGDNESQKVNDCIYVDEEYVVD